MRAPQRLLPGLQCWAARRAGSLHTPEGGPSTSTAALGVLEAVRGVATASASPAAPQQQPAAAASPPAPAASAARFDLDQHARRLREQLEGPRLLVQQQQLLQQQQRQQQQQEQEGPWGTLLAGRAAPAQGGPGSLEQQQRQQQQQSRRRRLDVSAIPMLRVPSKRDAPAPPPPAGDPRAPSVDWREIVERARRTQERVGGAQMLTDTFSRKHTYLRISLTERCNLRCTYCMPADGVQLTAGERLLTAGEVQRLASLFVSAGVDKIRLTGGEPTVRPDLADICSRLSALPGLRTLALTSNGIALKRQLPQLKAAGLSALNISLDTLRPDRFEALTRRGGHARVLAAVEEALRLGYDPVKVNVVVMRGVNDDEVNDFVELTRDAPINVRFIEYMPFDGNVWSDSKMVPYRELLASIGAAHPGALAREDDPAGEVAKNFRLRGHRGTVSFVTSMTHAFCGDCNRLRLLADGSLKVCLFGANEVSLRDAMRAGASDEELALVISAAVDRKRAAHAGMFELAATANRPMITIGG
ncbi:hypothetical protein Rsub_12046 [Raphidocelis subcapitata]|uniref:GTP 3',8-cyclase n=1 Tax=Raphidocelis subcapitata TaxID=307507 RepID=A0A2V0PHQ1_9CHLO|nr:hypothetical protein Rsub_12046 [Raphidocelis subcapitata]|eukprot:GBF99286.1 hypothetical protein Rsub_12046 [Raphidocelis subcapitata]